MIDKYVLSETGEVVPEPDLMAWARWMQTAHDARRLAREAISDGVHVSTVFLGLDHNFGEGPAMLWETLVFGGPHDGAMERYATRDEALAGHAAMVAKVRA